MVMRTVASSLASAASGSSAPTIVPSNISNDSEQALASPSPRCGACANPTPGDGTNSGTSIVVRDDKLKCPPANNNMSVANTTEKAAEGWCLSANSAAKTEKARGDEIYPGTTSREQEVMAHLEECLTHMTHLRDWLRLLDDEISSLHSKLSQL